MPLSTQPQVDDPDRLAALHDIGVLDTAPEPAFDDIVRLATRLCATPVALVSLVDKDRQWFKARVGFPHCETDLNSSVCKYVLAEPDIVVFPDLTADPRTASNPLVTGEPFIRFYAGAPLRTQDGHALGSLCVIDTIPRPAGLTSEQADDLRALARQVSSLLAMRSGIERRDDALDRQSAAIRQAKRLDILARASEALLTAADPAAVLDPILTTNADALGFDRSYTYDLWPDGQHLRLTHSLNAAEDLQAYLRKMPYGAPLCGIIAERQRPLVLEGVQLSGEPDYQIARGNGIDAYAGYPIMSRGALRGVISFASSRTPAFDPETLAFFETIARMMSAVYERIDGEAVLRASDAVARENIERVQLALAAGAIMGTWHWDIQGDKFTADEGFARSFGLDPVQAREGLHLSEVVEMVHLDDQAGLAEAIQEAIARGGAYSHQYRVRRADGQYYWVEANGRVYHGMDGTPLTFPGVLIDIEGSRAVARERDRVAEQLRQAVVRQDALIQIGDRLRDLTTVSEMTRTASEIVGRTLGVSRAAFGRIDSSGEYVDIEPDWTENGVASIAGRYRFDDFGDLRSTLARGAPLVIDDTATDARSTSHADNYAQLAIGALVNMPVRERGRTVAVLIAHDVKPRTWTDTSLAFLRNVADRLEVGIARLEAEAERQVLSQELSHRLKNTLAVVQSISRQTLRTVPEREPVEAFEKRILALGAAHDILLKQSWAAADIGEVVRTVLEAGAPLDRCDLDGPWVRLGPRATMSISLLLHEMATNAQKYGALSMDGGRVAVAWKVQPAEKEPELALTWRETGGPPAAPPAQRGFGSRLINSGLTGTGGVTLHYLPEGLEANFRAPMSQVGQS